MKYIKTFEEFVNESKKIQSKLVLVDTTELEKQFHKLASKFKLELYPDEYNIPGTNTISFGIKNIKWENPYAIGSHHMNARDYTNSSRKGSIGSKQLENLAKSLRDLRAKYPKDNFGLYYDGTRNWYLYIQKRFENK